MGTSPSGGRDSNSPTSTSTEGKIGGPLRCSVCDALFDTEEQITNHSRQVHRQRRKLMRKILLESEVSSP